MPWQPLDATNTIRTRPALSFCAEPRLWVAAERAEAVNLFEAPVSGIY